MRRIKLRATAICLSLFFLGNTANAQDQGQITLAPAQAEVLANILLQQGRIQEAIDLSDVLLQSDPDSYRLLMLHAAASLRGQDYSGTVNAAAKAYSAAQSDVQHFQAARLAALAQFQRDRYVAAQFWLLRASKFVPNEGVKESVKREFNQISRANPLSTNIKLSIGPDDNVNNGAFIDSFEYLGLPFVLSPDAKALEGYEAVADVFLKYRLNETQKHRTELGLRLVNKAYRLSSSAELAAPDADASDYAFRQIELSLGHRRLIWPEYGVSTAAISAGKNWYGGEELAQYLKLWTSQGFKLSDTSNLNLGLGYDLQYPSDPATQRSDIRNLTLGLNKALQSGSRLRLSALISDTASEQASEENTRIQGDILYQFAKPLLGAKTTAGLSLATKDYPVSSFNPDGRKDEIAAANLNMVFEKQSFYGFAPSISLNASKTESSVDLYDRKSLGLGFTLQFTF